MAIAGGGLLHYGGSATEPPPVDYYRASYAFLVQQVMDSFFFVMNKHTRLYTHSWGDADG